jgi:hypothetical protein
MADAKRWLTNPNQLLGYPRALIVNESRGIPVVASFRQHNYDTMRSFLAVWERTSRHSTSCPLTSTSFCLTRAIRAAIRAAKAKLFFVPGIGRYGDDCA